VSQVIASTSAESRRPRKRRANADSTAPAVPPQKGPQKGAFCFIQENHKKGIQCWQEKTKEIRNSGFNN